MDYLLAQAKEQANKGIPIVPLDSEPEQRLITKRGAVCTCAAAIACMGSGLGFGTLIPADQTPQITQLQEALINKDKKINELVRLVLEDDEDSSLLTSLEEKKDKLERDNEIRKANQIEQNNTILKLQGEKDTLTLQVDKQLKEIEELKKKNWETKVDLEIANYQRTIAIIELTEENRELHSKLLKVTGEGIKQFLKKLCEKGKWSGIGRLYNNNYRATNCSQFVDEIKTE